MTASDVRPKKAAIPSKKTSASDVRPSPRKLPRIDHEGSRQQYLLRRLAGSTQFRYNDKDSQKAACSAALDALNVLLASEGTPTVAEYSKGI